MRNAACASVLEVLHYSSGDAMYLNHPCEALPVVARGVCTIIRAVLLCAQSGALRQAECALSVFCSPRPNRLAS